MTGEQRERVVRYLGNGAKLREAADMVGASWKDFASDWSDGRADSESGTDSDAATFYRDARAARSRNIAEKRAEAAAAAGSRESADLLAYVRQLESEEEPLATPEDDVRSTPLLRVSDLIADPSTPPDERARLKKAAYAEACRGLHGLLRELTQRDARRREGVANA